MIKKLHVFDFDGTLVDSSHRYRSQICADGVERIDLPHWRANEYRLMDDTVLPLADTFRALRESPNDFVMVATARIWCELSQQFVIVNDLVSHVVGRKSAEDSRGGVALKVAGIRRLLNLRPFRGIEEIHVYEDNRDYLDGILSSFPELRGVPHFFESNQGH